MVFDLHILLITFKLKYKNKMFSEIKQYTLIAVV